MRTREMLSLSSVSLMGLLLLLNDGYVASFAPSLPILQLSLSQPRTTTRTRRFYSIYDDQDDEDDSDDDEDDLIDVDSLGDWRAFRRNLATAEEGPRKSVSKENEAVLKSQSEDLAAEYASGIWAHTTATVSEEWSWLDDV